MKLTIAIPTYNRAALLRRTLQSVAAVRIPDGAEAECIVIDNKSNDDTAAVVEFASGSARVPIRRVLEPRQGSSYARNRAIDEAGGERILFLDDDVIASESWAVELLNAMEGRGLDAVCGTVLPQWPGELPAWLGPQLYVKLAVHDAATKDPRESLDNYFSANVGFRRATFDKHGRFRTDLGVVGGNPISGEDTELFARIIAGGGKLGFAERAIVHHLIPPERLTRGYFRKKSFAFGVGSGIKRGRSHNGLEKLVRNLLRMAAARARGDRTRAFYHQLECINFFGYWRGRMMSRSQFQT